MRRFHSRHYIRATVPVILGLAFASCKGSGPMGPIAAPIQLSTTTLLFTNTTEQQVTITNLRSEAIDWRVLSTTASWLRAAPGSGSIGPGGYGTLAVQIDREAVPQGTHSALLNIGAGGGSVAVNVSVQPAAAAQAALQPQALSFAPSESSRSIEVVNSGDSALDWSLSGPNWLLLSATSGSLAPGGRKQIIVTAVRTGLAGGRYTGTLRLISNGGSPIADIILDVAGDSGLRLEPGTLDFGASGSQASLRLVNVTIGTLFWSAQPEGPWISLSSTSGQLPPGLSQLLTVQVERGGLSHGTNQAPILFWTSGGATSATVKATVQPASSPNPSAPGGAEITVTPVSLDFGVTVTDLGFQIFNGGDQPLDWTAQTQASWIILSTTAGRVSPHSSAMFPVRVSRSGLSPGTYQSPLQFSSSVGTVTAVVLATIGASTPPPSSSPPPPGTPPTNSGPARLGASPTSLDFGQTGTELTLKVENAGGSELIWSSQASNGWITVSPKNGNVAPGAFQNVAIQVTRSALAAAGNYQGSIQLTSNGGASTVSLSAEVAGSTSPPTPAPAKLAVTPTSLNFGSTTTEMTFSIQNAGGLALTWTSESANIWVTVPIASGQVAPGSSQSVSVRVSRALLAAAGTYQSLVQVVSNGGSATVSVSLQVPAPPPPPPSGGSSMVNVLEFGAKGDGVTDDAPAIDAAIRALPSTGGTVVIPAGTYMLSSISPSPNKGINLTKKTNVTVAGSGMDRTILKMAPATYTGATNTILIAYSSNITIKDLLIDGNPAKVNYYDEQSHSIKIASSSDIHIERVAFSGSGGDAIQVIGLVDNGDPWTERVWIENSRLTYTRRNGISIQRGVRDLKILGNTFQDVSQQDVSAEPSGSGAPRELLIENNTFLHNASAAWSVALGGIRPNQADLITDVTFRNNIVEGAVFFIWTDGLLLENNSIRGDRYHSPLRLQDLTHGVIKDNDIFADSEAGIGAVQILNDDGRLSSDIAVIDNYISVGPGVSGIYVKDASGGITVRGNQVHGSGQGLGIQLKSLLVLGIVRAGFVIDNNIVDNFATAISVVAIGDNFRSVNIIGNSITHDQSHPTTTIGILFDKTGPYENIANVASNTFDSGIMTRILVK